MNVLFDYPLVWQVYLAGMQQVQLRSFTFLTTYSPWQPVSRQSGLLIVNLMAVQTANGPQVRKRRIVIPL